MAYNQVTGIPIYIKPYKGNILDISIVKISWHI